jgi:hypothetical protein
MIYHGYKCYLVLIKITNFRDKFEPNEKILHVKSSNLRTILYLKTTNNSYNYFQKILKNVINFYALR